MKFFTLHISKNKKNISNHIVKKGIGLLLVFAMIGWGQMSWGQIVGWDVSSLPGGVNNFGPSPYNPTTTAANVTATGFVRGSGMLTSGTGAARGWGGTDFIAATSANAITANDFFTFTVKANAGYALSLSTRDLPL